MVPEVLTAEGIFMGMVPVEFGEYSDNDPVESKKGVDAVLVFSLAVASVDPNQLRSQIERAKTGALPAQTSKLNIA